MNQSSEQIDLVFEGLGLSGSIFISNFAAANNTHTLAKLGIKAVVTTARGLLLPHSKEQLPNYLYLPVDDTEEQSLGKFFPTVFDFIQKNRARTNVLVHCLAGISRSSAFIIAYLIKKYGYTVNQSLLLLKRRKRRIKPNQSFMRQLQKYQLEVREERERKLNKIPVGNELEYGKKLDLVSELKTIKACSQHLETKISQAKEKILDSQRRRRSSSDYLQQRLMEKSLTSSRNNSRSGSVCGDTPKKGQLDMQLLKGALSAIRSSVS